MPEAPPPLDDHRGYQAWRAAKLRKFALDQGLARVDLPSLAPSDREMQPLWRALAGANMVLVRLGDTRVLAHDGKEAGDALLALGRRLGLHQLDHNPCADDNAVSRLEDRATATNDLSALRQVPPRQSLEETPAHDQPARDHAGAAAAPDQPVPATAEQQASSAAAALTMRVTANLMDSSSGADGATRVRPTMRPRPGGDYIPYTNRALGWHTDGYYNPPAAAVRAWMLFCVRPAASGGENALLDPELAYLWLRDRDPALIAALTHPRAFCIPANLRDGKERRPRTCGPVFARRDGQLLMRYSARARNIDWHPEAASARAALDELFSSQCDFILRHKLSAGEGYITRNVLHTRGAFTDRAQVANAASLADAASSEGEAGTREGTGRLLLRVRYRDALRGPA